MEPIDIARIAHETNRAYCQALGDYSQVKWESAPAWQVNSAIAGVVGIVSGRISSPREAHISWMAQKEADGWAYGPDKDPDNKLHPCMVAYDKLPESQRRKDSLFFAVVLALK
jgi:RyR domain.